MSETWRALAESLCSDLKTTFGTRLEAVVAYGPQLEGHPTAPLACLALVSSLSMEDLEACARQAPRWSRGGVATPLVLPVEEFRRSLDVFPLEYAEIIRAHERVHGDDPFATLVIDPGDLRRACEAQVKSHLLHLREEFIDAGGAPTAVAELVVASAPAFAALLRNVARLTGVHTSHRTDATLAGARAAGLPEGIVADVLSLEHPAPISRADPARLFPAYLAAVEQLARVVDTWH